jgi:hypothetical protein
MHSSENIGCVRFAFSFFPLYYSPDNQREQVVAETVAIALSCPSMEENKSLPVMVYFGSIFSVLSHRKVALLQIQVSDTFCDVFWG